MAKKQTIGSLLVAIGVDLTDFEKKMNDVNRQFGKLGQQVQDAGQQIGMAFGAVSLAIAGGLGYAVKQAATFEQGLSNIKAVSGATAQEMEQLKQLALEMGASTKYSATEAAQGIEELVKAGVSMTDITNGGLKGALSLATAGGLELAQAAEIASTALNAFRKDGLNVSQAADILAGAANASATSVEELQYGLSQVAVVASSVGMSFQDTSTALAVFAQNGLKGSDAGTSLKTALNRLQPTTKETEAIFKELGITTADGSNKFYDAAGQLKGIDQIAQILQNSMKDLNDAQRQQAMMTIFGSDAIRAGNILFAEGAKGITNMKNAMSKVTAEQVAAEKMNNLNGAIEQLKGSFETLMISLGETLVPVVKSAAKFLGKMVEGFNKLSPGFKKFIVITATVIAILTGLVAIVATLTIGLGFLAAAEWAVLAPLLATIGIVVAVIAGLALLGVAIGMLYKKNKTFAKFVDTVWNGIKTVISTVVGAIVPVIKEVWSSFKSNVMALWQTIKPILTQLWSTISGLFKSLSNNGRSLIGFKHVVTGVFKAIGTFIKVSLTATIGVIKFALVGILTAFRVSLTAIRLVVTVAFNVIKTIIKNAMAVISGVIKVVTSIIRGDWSGAWNAIRETVRTVVGNIGNFLTSMTNTFAEAGRGFIDALVDGITGASKGVYDTVKELAQTIRDFLPFSPAKVGPLSDLNHLDFGNPISDAIRAGAPDVQAQMNSMLTVPDVNPSVLMDNGGGTTVIMQLDSKTIAKKTFDYAGGVFRLRGAVT